MNKNTTSDQNDPRPFFDALVIWDFTGTLACEPFLYRTRLAKGEQRNTSETSTDILCRACWKRFAADLDINTPSNQEIKELQFDYKKASQFFGLEEELICESMEKIRTDLKSDYIFLPGMKNALAYVKSKGWGNVLVTGGCPLKESRTDFGENQHLFEEFDYSITENNQQHFLGKDDERLLDLLHQQFRFNRLIVIGDLEDEMQMAKNLKADEVFQIGYPDYWDKLPYYLKPEFLSGDSVIPSSGKESKRLFLNGLDLLPALQEIGNKVNTKTCPLFLLLEKNGGRG